MDNYLSIYYKNRRLVYSFKNDLTTIKNLKNLCGDRKRGWYSLNYLRKFYNHYSGKGCTITRIVEMFQVTFLQLRHPGLESDRKIILRSVSNNIWKKIKREKQVSPCRPGMG